MGHQQPWREPRTLTAFDLEVMFTLGAIVGVLGLTSACADMSDAESEPSNLQGLVAQIEPDCTREGEFTLELGEDRDGFAALAEGEEPMLYHGAQGGTHLILAGHVTTPDPLDRYEIELTAEVGAQDCVDPSCSSFTIAGQIMRVIEGTDRIELFDDAVELPYLFLVVDGWKPDRIRKLTLTVSDACGRSSTDMRAFDSAP